MIRRLLFVLLFLTVSAWAQPSFPSSITNLQLRYEADCITSGPCANPADGTNISAWADQSGNGRNGTVASGTCTLHTNRINSKSAVTFTGDCHIDFTGIDLSGAATVFILFKTTSPTTKNEILTGDTFSLAYMSGNTSDPRQQWAVQDNYIGAHFGNASADTNFHSVNVAYAAGGTSDFRLDCASDGSTASGAGFSGSSSGLGRDKPDGGNAFPFRGDLAFLAIYDRKLNSTEIGQVEGYLTGKYGVLGSCSPPATYVSTCAPWVICPGH